MSVAAMTVVRLGELGYHGYDQFSSPAQCDLGRERGGGRHCGAHTSVAEGTVDSAGATGWTVKVLVGGSGSACLG